MTLGHKLKLLREHKRLTQGDLAVLLQRRYEGCKITRDDIANWEVDRHQPRIDKGKILVRFFQVTLDDLYFDNKTEFLKSLDQKNKLKIA